MPRSSSTPWYRGGIKASRSNPCGRKSGTHFGVWPCDRPDLRVQVVRKQDSLSLVDVHGPEDPVKTITPMQAMELASLLRAIGEEALGQVIATAATKAQKGQSRSTGIGTWHPR